MGIITVLLPATIFLALMFLAWYVWALRAGQFDDLETPARRMLIDESDTREVTRGDLPETRTSSPSESCDARKQDPQVL